MDCLRFRTHAATDRHAEENLFENSGVRDEGLDMNDLKDEGKDDIHTDVSLVVNSSDEECRFCEQKSCMKEQSSPAHTGTKSKCILERFR